MEDNDIVFRRRLEVLANESRSLSKLLVSKTFHCLRVSLLHRFPQPPNDGELEVWRENSLSLDRFYRSSSTLCNTHHFLSTFQVVENDEDAVVSRMLNPPVAIVTCTRRQQERAEIVNKSTPSLVAVLVCPSFVSAAVEKGFSCYPLLLLKGPKTLTLPFLLWLQRRFDCKCSALRLHPRFLCDLTNHWSLLGAQSGISAKPLELLFAAPPEVARQGLSKITVTIPSAAISDLVAQLSAHSRSNGSPSQRRGRRGSDGSASEASLESPESIGQGSYSIAFFSQPFEGDGGPTGPTIVDALAAYIFSRFRIDVRGLSLVKIGTSLALLSSEGRLKCFQAATILDVIDHVGYIATQREYSKNA